MGTKETGREYEPKIDNFNNQHHRSNISAIVVPSIDSFQLYKIVYYPMGTRFKKKVSLDLTVGVLKEILFSASSRDSTLTFLFISQSNTLIT